ncbi:hypothetical protein [Xanthovirga aplysinae]|uniref:hypothetical protein n=1 Tax=Xanthovirga aplysinae TaxID=2529853 RepID=UPI0012BC84A5|nr:hypothetical protein [Xanthovirga aplysinae]MTI29815.1 hypothetical protein [Xanthovirga aplysinae]
MKTKFFQIALLDQKAIFRDSSLVFFLLVSLFLFVVVRFGLPYLIEEFPVVDNYLIYILMYVGMQAPVLFGFVTSFVFLDEKDDHIYDFVMVSPVTMPAYVVSKLILPSFFSFLMSFFILYFNGLQFFSLMHCFLLGLMYALLTPFLTLVVAGLAKNKVEGMTYLKALNLLLILPMLSFFFPYKGLMALAVIPVYWVFHFFQGVAQAEKAIFYLAIGLIYELVLTCLLIYFFVKRMR